MATRMLVIHHPEGYAAIDVRVQRVGDAVADSVAAEARVRAPKKSGELASTIKSKRHRAHTWRVTVGTEYWSAQEYGVPYRGIIQPRLKQALWWPGLAHPIARVNNHPGNRAQPFMRPALFRRRRILVMPTGAVVVSV